MSDGKVSCFRSSGATKRRRGRRNHFRGFNEKISAWLSINQASSQEVNAVEELLRSTAQVGDSVMWQTHRFGGKKVALILWYINGMLLQKTTSEDTFKHMIKHGGGSIVGR